MKPMNLLTGIGLICLAVLCLMFGCDTYDDDNQSTVGMLDASNTEPDSGDTDTDSDGDSDGDSDSDANTDTDTDTGDQYLSLYRSGDRIKRIMGTTPDGAESFEGWYDKKLQTICSFAPKFADGVSRCMPSVNPQYITTQYFEDEDCEIQLAYTHSECEPTVRWVYLSVDQCDGITRVGRIQGVYDGPVYTMISERCTDVSDDVVSTLYAIQELDLDVLQVMEKTIEG